MTTYTAPHKATDRSKIAGLVRALRRGELVTPVVINGYAAITGSHRLAAGKIAKCEIPTVECSDLDYRRAAYAANVETHDENFNLFCSALLAVTENDDLKAALLDQTDGDYVDASRIADAIEMDEQQLTEHRGW
jgi:hypothetical protein